MLRDLRTKGSLPVIMLTSRRTPVDRILGLELGADDYIAKPFELAELRARIRAVLRRARQVEDSDVAGSIEALTFAGLILDLTHRRLLGADGKELLLTSGEFDLLRVFAEHPRRPLTQNQLMDLARARNWTPCDRSMDMLVSRLRRRIASVVHGAEIIATARNVGYVFDVKVDRRLLVASAVRASLG
jgi:DNA-binding response OmpR family regulator